MNKIFALLVVCSFVQSAKSQEVISLYPSTAPGCLEVPDMEIASKSSKGNGRPFVANVTHPTITVYLPKNRNAIRSSVIICPGGGYSRLSIEDGGYEAAKVFAEAGIAAFVLKYRTWRDSAYTNYKLAPFQDLTQALNIVYANAGKWNIDTTKIGILGFSAGGHLTSMAAVTFQKYKPAFTLLIYPVISFTDSLTSKTSSSRSTLLEGVITDADKRAYSPELHISKHTPPAFIVHATDDKTSLVGNSIAYYNGLLANKVPAQLLIYEKGGHGFAMYNKEEDKYWFPDALKWLNQNGFYKQ